MRLTCDELRLNKFRQYLKFCAFDGKVDNKILTQEEAEVIQSFGIKQDLSELETHSWLAVIDGGKILYETVPGEEDAADSYEGTAGDLHYTVSSGRVEEETGKIRSDASIRVNLLEYTSDKKFFTYCRHKSARQYGNPHIVTGYTCRNTVGKGVCYKIFLQKS